VFGVRRLGLPIAQVLPYRAFWWPDKFPFHLGQALPQFAINQAWLLLALVAIDLIAWTQHLLLDGEIAKAEPKKLLYRLLHVAARITRSARRTRVRLAQTWPWATNLVTAFARLAGLPRPAH
jgi:hypothetical protein